MLWHAYGIYTGSQYIGTIEAASEEEAKEKAEAMCDGVISLCHECSDQIDLSDLNEIQVNPAE